MDEGYNTGDSKIEHESEVPLGSDEKKFITSPTNIHVHRKVDLQNAEGMEEQQEAFEELGNEYTEISFQWILVT